MLQPIINELDHVKKYNSSALINRQLRLRSFLPAKINSYYKYVGSLTTPPCSETVTWIVFATMKDMSLDQLEMFDNLDSKENQFMFYTNRHLQPLNDRFVYLSSLEHCNNNPKYNYYDYYF